MTIPQPIRITLLLLAVSLPATIAAEVRSIEIRRREPFAGGAAFGDTGPYERIIGVVRYEVDPAHPRNRGIIDLELVPRNERGKVEFEADLFILAPQDPAKGNGAILYDVNNRGNKLALGFFNSAPGGNDPAALADAGNGFLFRRGYTVVWCGWIGELLPGGGRLLLKAPPALQDGKPVRGLARFEMVTDAPAETLPLSRRPGHGSYDPTERGEAEGLLTWRLREGEERVLLPRPQWSIERRPPAPVDVGVQGTLGEIRLRVAGGFRPGYIYELVCEAQGSIVQGLGFAAVRDLISFLRYEIGEQNPLARGGALALHRAYAFGVSQSGRFLRNLLYLGFNEDETGRIIFDALFPHVAGGGLGFFNHRFAQPTRHNGQHEEHLYPGDRFPFAYGDALDPFSGRMDGLLRRVLQKRDPRLLPKIFQTQSAAEYWHRSGSLIHTDPLGSRDVEIPGNVRLYAFGGTQHGPAGNPPDRGIADHLLNPADYRPFLGALLDALDAWVRGGAPPPPSIYPRIDQGTLVPFDQMSTGFPALPGTRYPQVIQRPPALDHGPEFEEKGIIACEPPRILGSYGVRVPKSDPDGNDLGTLLLPEVAVPLATYTGWNLRRRDAGAEGMLASLAGSHIPFPKTKAERQAAGDPRPSIEERYGGFENYEKRFREACEKLVQERYLLPEDAERLIRSRQELRAWFPETPPNK